MNNITLEKNESTKMRKYEHIVLLANGCFSLVLSASTLSANIILIVATARSHIRFNKVINKLHEAFFWTNILASVIFLPYFGIAEILHGLQIGEKAFSFPSYLSVTFVFFAQSNAKMALLITAERSSAFTFPHLHRRMMTKTKMLTTLILTDSFAVFCSCLQFTGTNEVVFFKIYIHIFISMPICIIFILVVLTFWQIRSRNMVVSGEIPQSSEQLQRRRKRSVRTARKYVAVVSLFMVPICLCILPWYIMNIIESKDAENLHMTGTKFVFQRLSMPLLFLPDLLGPVTVVLRFEDYSIAVKRLLRRWK